MATELKPCPFCGGKAKIMARQRRFLGQNCFGNKKVESQSKQNRSFFTIKNTEALQLEAFTLLNFGSVLDTV